ncbi:homoserine O-succinyltransferase [Arsenicicoccus piscis]|uniref:Homoserine O-acetyltransferase n=1 Tax=Arsenicicoccus piscis TaxID=673954 RepID=A0ABQ6HKA9_9MICO|nr:homoserine O-succinyltransferase [Arsenicicoccus piscis]MCH8627149.1 homoserine O-succinyltransferase [Arsenicicoccus piscis]GMA18894.1 homoserine O-succinyltransferase [Arsenicicoccus piscis]
MPVTIPRDLPARVTLEAENVFLMTEDRAFTQDIRPLKIAVVNLMPTKVATETQLLRLLGNTPLQVQITFLAMASHESRNTSSEHLDAFYATFEQVRDERFDGLVITGAPIELLPFEQVNYWDELCQIMDWSLDNVFSTLYICWGAQAGLYRHHGIEKIVLPDKMFGVFDHRILRPHARVLSGFDEVFPAPHSRHTGTRAQDIHAAEGIEVLAESDEAGVYLAASEDGRQIFVTGHPEYEWDTLLAEYQRDVSRGLDVPVPRNYFPGDDPTQKPRVTWRSHAFLLYANWLNHCVYQRTPYDLGALSTSEHHPGDDWVI